MSSWLDVKYTSVNGMYMPNISSMEVIGNFYAICGLGLSDIIFADINNWVDAMKLVRSGYKLRYDWEANDSNVGGRVTFPNADFRRTIVVYETVDPKMNKVLTEHYNKLIAHRKVKATSDLIAKSCVRGNFPYHLLPEAE